MNTFKQEKKARILTLNKHFNDENEQTISEVTRSLFTDAWRSYLDQTSMGAVKLEDVTLTKAKDKFSVIKSNLKVVH